MANLPACANSLEGVCPRSDVYVEREGDSFFTLRCRTCQGINVWPKERDENRGRYEAGLKHFASRSEQERATQLRRTFSMPSPKENR